MVMVMVMGGVGHEKKIEKQTSFYPQIKVRAHTSLFLDWWKKIRFDLI